MQISIEKQTPRYENLRVSREEYLDLEEDGFRYDMIDGVLYMSPSPNFEHANYAGNFYLIVGNFLNKQKIGKAVMEMEVLLPDGGDIIRPDISVLLSENLNKVKMHIHGSPDIVVEIFSPSTRNIDLGIKSNRYLNCGVKEYWIIDPKEKTVSVRRNEKLTWKKETHQVLQSNILKGMEITSTEIFE